MVVAAATLALRSFLAAWFGCALLFLYPLPLVAAGNHNVLGSFYASAHLAVRRFGTTVLAAVMIEIIGVFALGAASVLSGLPFAGQFLQSLVLQLAIGFFAVFALEQLLAVRAVENRVPILAPVFRPEVTP